MEMMPTKVLRLYPDTCLLRGYVEEDEAEKKAMKKLWKANRNNLIIEWKSSRRVSEEIKRAKSKRARRRLENNYQKMDKLVGDHEVKGFFNSIDAAGGYTCNPLVADVPDSTIFTGLIDIGLRMKDAKNLVVAIHNKCDVFLTRDVRTILKFREKIEAAFPIKVRKASEQLREIRSGHW